MKISACTLFIAIACATTYGAVLRNGEQPPTTLQAKEAAINEALKDDRIPLESTAFTNVVSAIVSSSTNTLGGDLPSLLKGAICQWGRSLHTGEFGDFLDFRQPDYFVFTEFMDAAISNRQVAANHPMPQTALGKARSHFDMLNRVTFDGVAQNSLRIVFPAYASVTDATNSNIRLRYILKHWTPSTSSKHASSPLRYKVTPRDVVEVHGRVQCALVSGRFISKSGNYALLLHVMWFWSVQEHKWKPCEFYMDSVMPIKPDQLSPNLYF